MTHPPAPGRPSAQATKRGRLWSWSSRSRGTRGQRGATTVEFAIAALTVLAIFVAVGGGFLILFAQVLVVTAAQDAARTAAVAGGTPAAGRARAQALLTTGLGSVAEQATIRIQRGTHTRVTVTFPLTALLPLPAAPHLQGTDVQLTEPTIPTNP